MAYGTRGLMLHSQGLSSNPYPKPNQPNSSYYIYFFNLHSNMFSHLRLDLPKGLFTAGIPVKILKELLQFLILLKTFALIRFQWFAKGQSLSCYIVIFQSV